jgi:hypothetical protein
MMMIVGYALKSQYEFEVKKLCGLHEAHPPVREAQCMLDLLNSTLSPA